MKKAILASLAILLHITSATAQQEPLVSNNVFNGMLLNPAYSGSHSYFSAGLLFRTQWVGFEGAPKTQMLEFDGPLFKEKMGVGCVISHDKIGVTEQTDIYASYSYKIKVGNSKLALGLSAGTSNYTAKVSTLTVWDSGDEMFDNDVKNYFIPKFGFGMYFFGEKHFAGFSIPTLVAYDKNYDFSVNISKASFFRNHYYLNGGYIFNIKESIFKLKETILLKYTHAAPVQAEISSSIIYKDMFLFGLAFRTGDAVVALIEYRTAQRIRIGYAFDFTFSRLRNYSDGTHEVKLSYEFGAGKDTNVSPRFF